MFMKCDCPHGEASVLCVHCLQLAAYGVQRGQLQPDPLLAHPMFFGEYGWKISEPRMLAEPIPCKGALGLWEVPVGFLEQIARVA